jgi:hypothetical protein
VRPDELQGAVELVVGVVAAVHPLPEPWANVTFSIFGEFDSFSTKIIIYVGNIHMYVPINVYLRWWEFFLKTTTLHSG